MGAANEIDLGGMTVLAKEFKTGSNTVGQGATVRQVTSAGSALTVTRASHLGKVILVDAAVSTITLPAASGSGDEYHFFVTVTSNTAQVIKVANSSDTMVGAIVGTTGSQGSGGDVAGGTDDTITMNGTTSGGIAGTKIDVKDIASNLWLVSGTVAFSGTSAAIFSATV